MRASGIYGIFSGLKLPFLCELSWLHFDGVEVEGPAAEPVNQTFMGLCGEAGMLLVLAPREISQYFIKWNPPTSYWFRWTDFSLTSGSCFGQTSCNEDQSEWYYPHNTSTAQEMLEGEDYSITTTVIDELSNYTIDYPALWFYDVYDEVPSTQRKHMFLDDEVWNDWIPNMYTQQWDNTQNPAVPALSEVEPASIFSWQKYLAETNITNAIPTTINFSLLHTILPGEYTGYGGCNYGTMARQAISVRAFCEAMYQGPPEDGQIPLPLPNYPGFICFDYYPFRYVDIIHASTTTMCDDDWLFLIDHFEEGIDSTVIPASEYDVPVFFYPQTFGDAGGPRVRDESGNLDYNSYNHRTPAPQEFLMLCNLALLHQAKAIFPYSLTSYIEDPSNPDGDNNFISSSLLDMHHIPFDAPYEDWVYTGRWPDTGDWEDKYEYADPRELPPFSDGFDPLYEVGDPPIVPGDDPKEDEAFFEWLFGAYGNLFNSLGNTFGQIAWIAPEMYDLWWWEENGTAYWDVAEITVPDSGLLDDFVSPRIRVFYNESNDHAYLFYMNRFCGKYYMGNTDEIPVDISIQGTQLPGSPGNPYLFEDALDHSRRCLVPIEEGYRDWYFFDDTLAAGESRLLEFVDLTSAIQADLRITSPDVFCYSEGLFSRRRELHCKAGTNLNLGATFYNMGTEATGNVMVTFIDRSGVNPVIIGSDVISLGGLSGDYEPDSTSAVITWNTDSGDIGAHSIEIIAATISGEDPLDNTATVTVLVKPRDYATHVRDDAWDMTEGGSNDWNTDDIEAVAENWNTSTGWTDSVSGMFEGLINYDPITYEFIGEINLAIPNDRTDYIDTDKYHMLSFGMVGNNTNQPNIGACAMFIRWKIDGVWQGPWRNLLSETDYHVGNGWDKWGVIGPIDLKNIGDLEWGTEDASELWLRMQGSGPPVEPLEPVDIRIGWIRLEESVQ